MTIFQKLFIHLYRGFAVVILGVVLLSAFSYFFLLIFFAANTTWGAPVILTKSSPRIAQMASQVLQAEQMVEKLNIEIKTSQEELLLMQRQYSEMDQLAQRFEASIEQQKKVDEGMSKQLSRLSNEKNNADDLMRRAVRENRALRQQLEKELKAGLLTREAAARTNAQLAATEASLQAALTGGRANTVTMQYQATNLGNEVATLEGESSSTKALENLARLTQLRTEIGQIELKMNRAKRELVVKQQEMEKLQGLLKTLAHSPYHRAATSDHQSHTFAFVPYDNQHLATPDTPVYACILKVVWCSQVGRIAAVTDDEERLRHPVFPSDVRGFLIDLNLDNVSSAKEKVLFFGNKPLFF